MSCSGRWLLAAAWLTAVAATSSPSRGQAPPSPQPLSEADLTTARRVFAEALRDEKDKRLDAALDGFRRVRDLRDSAAVEYRIGTCLEGLSRLAEALAAYDTAVRLSADDPAAADVAAGSRERVGALSRRVAHLALTLSANAPPDAEVRVDGKPERGRDIVLDPGRHRVEATASGAAPFQSDIALPEGGRIALTVPLSAAPARSTTPPEVGHPRTVVDRGSSETWGWIAIGAGTALVAGSVVSFVLRENDIRAANQDCPGGACVGAINDDALSATNRARIEGPLGFALGGVGIAAAAVGVYLIFHAPKSTTTLSVAPTTGMTGASLELGGTL